MNKNAIEQAIKQLLIAIGEDTEREGLKDTPARVGRMYADIFAGISQQSEDILKVRFKSENYNNIIFVADIPFYSMCEHHLLPFFGTADVAYIAGENGVLGLSKLARLVDIYAKRPQMQERLTQQIATDLIEVAGAKGAFCRLKARHFCMEMRGVQKAGATTTTQCFLGQMQEEFRKEEITTLLAK